VAGIGVRHLGDYIREQRSASDISLRQLAKLAGVSNPYLSQIERGLRKPSAEILQQIAKGLRISAEALYVQAGILDQREGSGLVADAVLADDSLNERQKQVLLEIYDSFRRENGPVAADEVAVTVVAAAPLEDAELSTSPAPPVRKPRRKPAGKPADTAAEQAAPTTPRATAGGRRASRARSAGPEAPDASTASTP
jgi:transcriptional regulator with XRE-family HTH domain